jgi:hypothetical protein
MEYTSIVVPGDPITALIFQVLFDKSSFPVFDPFQHGITCQGIAGMDKERQD